MNTALLTDRRRRRTRAAIGLIGGGLIILVAAANAHLVYVSVTSQPDCVAHLKPGDIAQNGSFRAAKSACSPGVRS
jgi:hypothetical protein